MHVFHYPPHLHFRGFAETFLWGALSKMACAKSHILVFCLIYDSALSRVLANHRFQRLKPNGSRITPAPYPYERVFVLQSDHAPGRSLIQWSEPLSFTALSQAQR